MRTILSVLFLLAVIGAKSQNNIVVFSENGEPFYLIVNGVKQNLEPETNVKVTDLIQPNYKIKVIFEEKGKGIVDQTIYLMNGGEPVKNYEFVYSIKLNKKAGYKIRPVSAVSTAEVKSDPSQTVVHYSTTEPTPSNNNVVSNGNDNATMSAPVNSNNQTNNTQVNQTVTQTQVSSSGTGNNTNVGVTMGGMGVSIKVNDNMAGDSDKNTTVVTTQTVTTTTTSSGNSGSNASMANANSGNSVPKTRANTTATTSPKSVTVANPLPGYTGAIGCERPMNAKEFSSAKTSIASKNFEDVKLKVAKQVMDNNCLLTSQVKEIMEVFSFDDARLDIAKYAYGHTYDVDNYYKLSDAFKFESSIDELDQYIKANKKQY